MVVKLFTFGFVFFAVISYIIESCFGNSATDIQLHDTYLVVANFHIAILLSLIMGFYALVYYITPKLIKRKLNKPLGLLHFWVTFIGLNYICIFLNYYGVTDVPSRYYDFESYDKQLISSLTIFKLVFLLIFVTQFSFFINIIYSCFKKSLYD